MESSSLIIPDLYLPGALNRNHQLIASLCLRFLCVFALNLLLCAERPIPHSSPLAKITRQIHAVTP